MISPIININGSSRDDLIKPRLEACDALMDAITAIQQATPNGRDYPGDAERCLADRQIHYDRIAALHELREKLYAEAIYIRGE